MHHAAQALFRGLGFSIAALALLPGSKAAEPLRVTSVRFWSLERATRVVVQVSGEFTYQHGRLSDPERLYFDISGARPALGRERIHTIAVADALLRQIRVSETRPNVTRVVLDLNQRVEFSASQLANPYRLVIELKPLQAHVPGKGPQATSGGQRSAILGPPTSPEVPVRAEPAKGSGPAPPPQRVAVPAKLGKSSPETLVRALGLKVRRVVIDPGHGGHDTGTVGPSGIMEKDLVLDIALRLGELVEQQLGAEVIYTRKDDTYVPLEARTALANEQKADLFISIHLNGGDKRAAGPETYYLNFTTSKEELAVAARENAPSERSIYELEALIQKILKKEKAEESRAFASAVQSALYKALVRYNSNTRDRGVRKAPFLVLIGANMPSVLVELGFLSNPREENLLKQNAYRQRLAEALFKGISDYAATLSRLEETASVSP